MAGGDERSESPASRSAGEEPSGQVPSEAGGPPPRTSLPELALLFARLGATAFGGPMAHVAVMRDEIVVRRRWMSQEHFLDLLGASQLLPGPTSTELAIHIGWARRGLAGLLVSGLAFVIPAALITGALAALYVAYGTLPQVAWLLAGIKPVIVAIIAHAVWMLAPTALRSRALMVLGGLATLAIALGVYEIFVLLGAGVCAATWGMARSSAPRVAWLPLTGLAAAQAAPLALSTVSSASIFGVFLKIGSVLFGSGYVLVALLRVELVERLGWITETQLMDSVAVGQVTPGPFFSTATFIGYLLSGPWGAAAATLAIFLPAFVLVSLSGPLVPRIRGSKVAARFLDGVNVASLALMAVVAIELARSCWADPLSIAIGVVSVVLLVRTRLNPTWLIALGAITVLVARALGLA